MIKVKVKIKNVENEIRFLIDKLLSDVGIEARVIIK